MFIKEVMWRWDDCWVVVANNRSVQFEYAPIIPQWNAIAEPLPIKSRELEIA